MNDSVTRYVVSILAEDRPGIVADVTETLYELGANFEALSQTVVGKWFTMAVCGAFPRDVDAAAIREAIEKHKGFHAIVAPFESDKGRPAVEGAPYVVTAVGKDRPGIVARLSRCFADRDVNIDDVWNEVREGQFIVIFHVTVPAHVDPKELRYQLEQAAEEAGVAVRLQHQDIFTATSSLSIHTVR